MRVRWGVALGSGRLFIRRLLCEHRVLTIYVDEIRPNDEGNNTWSDTVYEIVRFLQLLYYTAQSSQVSNAKVLMTTRGDLLRDI